MHEPRRRWFDDAAGPFVRPYAVTRGRTRSEGEPLDLIATVMGSPPSTADRMWLEPEHLRLLARCRQPITVADLASDMDLPLGVVRVLLGDLRERELIRVSSPTPSEYDRDEAVLRMVLDELNSL
ncbi:DUF742 domain-containing protein [Actinomadura sp. DC4]|uniref:DUF742 domain-containing protein n=1 Tax=Actinomadura sp. DC4 TaxID=3055069 RepID=UPI0025AED2FE|nr:DUF742 domain-containing protein [Actinomadura sp. DC4]MDN3351105.1 DUF742 domain-containing protein [Actinomadura sp. DC4]